MDGGFQIICLKEDSLDRDAISRVLKYFNKRKFIGSFFAKLLEIMRYHKDTCTNQKSTTNSSIVKWTKNTFYFWIILGCMSICRYRLYSQILFFIAFRKKKKREVIRRKHVQSCP